MTGFAAWLLTTRNSPGFASLAGCGSKGGTRDALTGVNSHAPPKTQKTIDGSAEFWYCITCVPGIKGDVFLKLVDSCVLGHRQ